MITPTKFALIIAFLFFVATGSALAQSSAVGSPAPVPAVTSSASAPHSVRFSSPGQILQIRLEIYSSNGDLVFDSGSRQGNIIDWKVSDATQPLTDGRRMNQRTWIY